MAGSFYFIPEELNLHQQKRFYLLELGFYLPVTGILFPLTRGFYSLLGKISRDFTYYWVKSPGIFSLLGKISSKIKLSKILMSRHLNQCLFT